MAKRGDAARAKVIETIQKAFQDAGALEGIVDKKIYVWAQDGPGGEKIQFAISITAPKSAVSCGNQVTSGDGAWSDDPTTPAPAPAAKELSDEDKQKVQDLMRQLGL